MVTGTSTIEFNRNLRHRGRMQALAGISRQRDTILSDKVSCLILRVLGYSKLLRCLGASSPTLYGWGVEEFNGVEQSENYQFLRELHDRVAFAQYGPTFASASPDTMTELQLLWSQAANVYCKLRRYLPKLPESLRQIGRDFCERFEQVRYQPDELGSWLMAARFLAMTWPDVHDVYDWLVEVRPQFSGSYEERCSSLISWIESSWCEALDLRPLMQEAYVLFGDHIDRLERIQQRAALAPKPAPRQPRPPTIGAKKRGVKSKGGKKKQAGGKS